MFVTSSTNWIDTLPAIQKSYNATPSPTLLNYSPSDILENKSARKKLSKYYALQRLKHHKAYEKTKPVPLEVGDRVRVVRDKETFSKDYAPGWSTEIFKIVSVRHETVPETYRLSDGTKKSYYRQQLSLVGDTTQDLKRDLFIDKTRKADAKQTRSGKQFFNATEYRLKSLRNPEDTRWIKEAEFQALKKKGLIST